MIWQGFRQNDLPSYLCTDPDPDFEYKVRRMLTVFSDEKVTETNMKIFKFAFNLKDENETSVDNFNNSSTYKASQLTEDSHLELVDQEKLNFEKNRKRRKSKVNARRSKARRSKINPR